MAARNWLLASVGVLVPVLATAQDSAQVLALLRSNTSIAMAWGAFEAGTFQMSEAVPALIAALETLPSGTEHEREFVAAAVLDALVQIHPIPGEPAGSHVPASVVAPYLDRWPIRTLVLLGRAGPEGDRVVLDLFRSLPRPKSVAASSPTEMWFALANLLVPRAPTGFAAMLLQGVRLELVVTVSDNGESSGDGGSGGLAIGDGFGQKPSGFPPHAIYRWGAQRAGNTVLSTGPETLYYSREVTTRFQFPLSYTARSEPTVDERLKYVGAIVPARSVRLASRTPLPLRWTNARAFRERVRSAQEEIAGTYARLLAQLTESGRLTTTEAAALPLPLTTTVRDVRRVRAPLPDVSTLPRP